MADESARQPKPSGDALDHMAEEFEEFEHEKTNWGRWIIGLVLLGVLVAAVLWFRQPSGPPVVTQSGEGVRLDLNEPAQVKLAQAPSFFRWESVAGRHHYVVVITSEKGDMAPIEKNVKNNNLTLTPSEIQMLQPGKSYVWKVIAVGDDGKTMASGAASFEL